MSAAAELVAGIKRRRLARRMTLSCPIGNGRARLDPEYRFAGLFAKESSGFFEINPRSTLVQK